MVVRGDPDQALFSAFCYKAGRLVGIELINRAGDHVFGRRILAANGSIEPEQAADPGFDLKAALASARGFTLRDGASRLLRVRSSKPSW